MHCPQNIYKAHAETMPLCCVNFHEVIYDREQGCKQFPHIFRQQLLY